MARRLYSVAMLAFAVSLLAQCSYAGQAEDIVKIKRDVLISSQMTVNDVVILDGNATVYGNVEGNIVVVGGSVYLKESARVKGNAVVIGGELVKDPASQLGGKVTQVYIPHFLPSLTTLLAGGWIAVWAAISLMVLLGFLGLSVLMIVLIPGHMDTMVGELSRSPVAMLLWGLFWTVMIAPVALLLAISIIGIILIPLEIVVASLAYLVGYIVAAIYIGKRISDSLKKSLPAFVNAMLGILVLYFVGFVPVLGAIIKAAFLMAGFGAVSVTRFGTVGGR